MNDSFSKSFLDSLQVKPRGPQISNEDYAKLKEAYDANKTAAMDAVGTTLAQFGIGVPLATLTHLFDAAMAVPKLFINPGEFAKDLERSKYEMGPMTDQVFDGVFVEGPLAQDKKQANNTMERTSDDARAYEKERNNRASAKQLETANLIDPMNFLKNLRGR